MFEPGEVTRSGRERAHPGGAADGICRPGADDRRQRERGKGRCCPFNRRTALALTYLVVVSDPRLFSIRVRAETSPGPDDLTLRAREPVIAVVLGALMLGEPMDSRILAAAGVILVGCAMVRSDP